jgi:hypothetical protein
MKKNHNTKSQLPNPVSIHLSKLGENLKIARRRRKESLALWAERMQVSVPTVRKMEIGDPCVSIATYATALWLIGRVNFLSAIADPSTDEVALMMELRGLKK